MKIRKTHSAFLSSHRKSSRWGSSAAATSARYAPYAIPSIVLLWSVYILQRTWSHSESDDLDESSSPLSRSLESSGSSNGNGVGHPRWKATPQNKFRIAMVSSFPPTRCGVGSHAARELTAIEVAGQAVNSRFKESSIQMDVFVMVAPSSRNLTFTAPVVFRIDKERVEDYHQAAKVINEQHYDMVMVQHEYGLFGGFYGTYLVELLRNLRPTIPVQMILYTVSLNNAMMGKLLINQFLPYTNQIICHPGPQTEVLEYQYPQLTGMATQIPLGEKQIYSDAMNIQPASLTKHKRASKQALGWDPDTVILMSAGLLTPRSKNLGFALDAVEILVQSQTNVVWVIVGETHPGWASKHGSYIEQLRAEAIKKRIEQHVQFVEQYVTDDTLSQYLQAADIFVCVYQGMDQTSTGMIPLAMSNGCAVISSPFLHASYLLQDGRGMVAPLNTGVFGLKLITLVSDESLRLRIATKGVQYVAQEASWEKVGELFLDSFERIGTSPKLALPRDHISYQDDRGVAIAAHGQYLGIPRGSHNAQLGLWSNNATYTEFVYVEFIVEFKLVVGGGEERSMEHRVGAGRTLTEIDKEGRIIMSDIVVDCSEKCENLFEVTIQWSIDKSGSLAADSTLSVTREASPPFTVSFTKCRFGVDGMQHFHSKEFDYVPQTDGTTTDSLYKNHNRAQGVVVHPPELEHGMQLELQGDSRYPFSVTADKAQENQNEIYHLYFSYEMGSETPWKKEGNKETFSLAHHLRLKPPVPKKTKTSAMTASK